MVQVVKEIAVKNHISVDTIHQHKESSMAFSVNQGTIIKLFKKNDKDFFAREKAFLEKLGSHITFTIPELRASGSQAEWLYIVMSRIPGTPLDDAWPSINQENRKQIVYDLGNKTWHLHSIKPQIIPELSINWDEFINQQNRTCRTRQERHGLNIDWLNQINPFLKSFNPDHETKHVILHTELMHQHVFVKETDEKWEISGLIDFEPSMIGPKEYEFASVGLFVSCGDPLLFKEFFKGYGYSEQQINQDLTRISMYYMLLHRYCHLPWFMKEVPVKEARTLLDLEKGWYGFS